MNLEILGLSSAVAYRPTNPTYAIRIHSARWRHQFTLQESGLYTIVEYTFDDNDPTKWWGGKISEDSITIDEQIAGKILGDFEEQGLDKDTLLVHCGLGKNRSPAVGMALNEIYDLGHKTEELKRTFPETNWYVYKMLLKVAKRFFLTP